MDEVKPTDRSALANQMRIRSRHLAEEANAWFSAWFSTMFDAIDAWQREPSLLRQIEQLEAENARLRAVAEAANNANT